jgi:hypothetical protein
MISRRELCVALAGGWALTACRTPAIPAEGTKPPSPDGPSEERYRAAFDRHTARAEIYEGLDQRLFLAGTYQSEAFVEARVRRMGAFLAQPEQEIQAALATELAALKESEHVFLGVHANNPRHEDFDRANSIWRLALVVGQSEVTPTGIERIGRPDENLRSLYPYLREFWVGYRVQFPRVSASGQRVLKIASSLGKALLTFEV